MYNTLGMDMCVQYIRYGYVCTSIPQHLQCHVFRYTCTCVFMYIFVFVCVCVLFMNVCTCMYPYMCLYVHV